VTDKKIAIVTKQLTQALQQVSYCYDQFTNIKYIKVDITTTTKYLLPIYHLNDYCILRHTLSHVLRHKQLFYYLKKINHWSKSIVLVALLSCQFIENKDQVMV